MGGCYKQKVYLVLLIFVRVNGDNLLLYIDANIAEARWKCATTLQFVLEICRPFVTSLRCRCVRFKLILRDIF